VVERVCDAVELPLFEGNFRLSREPETNLTAA
jgi:hypothetical protein